MFWIGIIVGFLVTASLYFLIRGMVAKAKAKVIDSIFSEILDGLRSGTSSFLGRVNFIIEVALRTPKLGDISLVYFVDTNKIGVFKNKECIYPGDICDPYILRNIQSEIVNRFAREIEDCVMINNSVMDKATYQRILLMRQQQQNPQSHRPVESFNLDDILDRINSIGYINLSDDEKSFLDKISKSK